MVGLAGEPSSNMTRPDKKIGVGIWPIGGVPAVPDDGKLFMDGIREGVEVGPGVPPALAPELELELDPPFCANAGTAHAASTPRIKNGNGRGLKSAMQNPGYAFSISQFYASGDLFHSTRLAPYTVVTDPYEQTRFSEDLGRAGSGQYGIAFNGG
jgi:hypothetical protein